MSRLGLPLLLGAGGADHLFMRTDTGQARATADFIGIAMQCAQSSALWRGGQ